MNGIIENSQCVPCFRHWNYGLEHLEVVPQKDHISQPPLEILPIIFSFLHPKEVLENARVCKEWNGVISEASLWEGYGSQLGKIFPKLYVLDRSVWLKCFGLEALREANIQFLDEEGGLEFSDIPACTKATILGLNHILAIPTEEGVEGDRFKVTLLTMPEGLSPNKIRKLSIAPQLGTATGMCYYWSEFLNHFGEETVPKTYRVALTNSLLIGSRAKTVLEQKQLLDKNGCQMPHVLEIMTDCFLRFINSSTEKTSTGVSIPPISLYGGFPPAYTCCKEQMQEHPFFVGGFFLPGLHGYKPKDSNHRERGTLARWQLPAIET